MPRKSESPAQASKVSMGRGVAVIRRSDDWEMAARHLWGISIADFKKIKRSRREPKPKPIVYKRIGAILLSEMPKEPKSAG